MARPTTIMPSKQEMFALLRVQGAANGLQEATQCKNKQRIRFWQDELKEALEEYYMYWGHSDLQQKDQTKALTGSRLVKGIIALEKEIDGHIHNIYESHDHYKELVQKIWHLANYEGEEEAI